MKTTVNEMNGQSCTAYKSDLLTKISHCPGLKTKYLEDLNELFLDWQSEQDWVNSMASEGAHQILKQ